MNKKKIILSAAAVIVVAGVAVWALSGGAKKQEVKYETAVVGRQDIADFVTATGSIEPRSRWARRSAASSTKST